MQTDRIRPGGVLMDELRNKRQADDPHAHSLHKLARIEAALDRLDSGTYGFCDTCGEPIAILRLERDPSVLVCGACIAKH